jgi:predicted transcriptional regulator
MVEKTNTLEALVKALEAIQTKEGMNDVEFARLLAIHPSAWSYITKGQRGIGIDILRNIVNSFPELEPLAIAYIKSDGNNQNEK